MRIGVALVQQETNTFAVRPCRWRDFTVVTGTQAAVHTLHTNSEMGGAIAAVEAAGHNATPLVYAWTLPSGRVTAKAFTRLRTLLVDQIRAAPGLDALVLALHGSMAADGHDDADGALIEAARSAAPSMLIGVCLDLHANVTRRMLRGADAMVGYRTDPHIDMAPTGRRITNQVVAMLEHSLSPAIALSKRPMIVPAESMNTTSGPLGPIRAAADAVGGGVVDVSLFPVQPWLDVAELGFGVLVTTNGDQGRSEVVAEEFADRVWSRRSSFRIPRFLQPSDAIETAARSKTRPFIIAESADAPTAGAAGDSPVMLSALIAADTGMTAVVPIVDRAAVGDCERAGVGSVVNLNVGGGIDGRWWDPVPFSGRVLRLGKGKYKLEGVGYTGIEVTMGDFAVVQASGISLLLSEKPAWTADPATFRFAGIEPSQVDLIVVRSCSDFRPNFPDSAEDAVTLDVPGAATPRLENLMFTKAPRPLWPLDRFGDDN